jgi:outer membrane beta-barrel protein
MWTPIYGKINAFGEVVLHYDLFVLAGAGVTSDEIEITNAAGVSTFTTKVFPATDFSLGQRFYLSRRIALRVELRPYIFWEQINNKWDPNGDVQIDTGLSFLF